MSDGTGASAGGSGRVPSLRAIYRARREVAAVVRRTPLVRSDALSAAAGGDVFLKLENLQLTGAFKARGAANALARLPAEARARGVVAVSTGNHGRAVATAAGRLGVRAVVCVSRRVPRDKLDALRATGCEVVVIGESQDEAEVRARDLVRERGLTLIHPFDDADVIAGQGTIALEILEDLPDVRLAVVPLSGGGLMAGVALALKSADPSVRVVGVSMERGAAMALSLKAGRPVDTVEEPTLADSLQGGIGRHNRLTLRWIGELADDVVLVSEDAIARAMRFAFEHDRQVLEGAGAVAVAALLEGTVRPEGGPAVAVCSGGNIAMERFLGVIEGAAPGAPPARGGAPGEGEPAARGEAGAGGVAADLAPEPAPDGGEPT